MTKPFGTDIPSSTSAGLRTAEVLDEASRVMQAQQAEIERLRAERDDVRAELTNLQIAFNDWKVAHSTTRLEVEIERLRAELKMLYDAASDLIEVTRMPNIEHVADAHNAAVRLLRTGHYGTAMNEGWK